MAAATSEEGAKVQVFVDWLQVNGAELRGCTINSSPKGFGIIFAEAQGSSDDDDDDVLVVVPLELAITPMRVLQEPLLGPECRSMFEQGHVDDRFLIILFLTFERLRPLSSWKPYLDMLPTRFGNPLWFSDDDFLELKGTNLYDATLLQKKKLLSLYHDKVEPLLKKLLLLDGASESNVSFEHFLWANSVFWSRALNLPLPHSFVFPQNQEDVGGCQSTPETDSHQKEIQDQVPGATSVGSGDTVWVEGLVPGIDFCNHDLKPVATWEVDGTGSISKVPFSMYLLSVAQNPIPNKEITISYGNKGNEELLYLYGFVIENNPDDYLMVHYPVEAIPSIPFSDSKGQLLEAQKAQLRCLLPKSLLDHGFFPQTTSKVRESDEKGTAARSCNFSWSGQRKTPSYVNKLVFPEDFMTGLRTIAMQEDEIYKFSAMLEELVESRPDEQPSETEVRMAVWEACGDSGALQLLVDLLNAKMMKLEENSGSEEQDAGLLEEACVLESHEQPRELEEEGKRMMSRNKWSSVVYRRGQKQLTRLFLKEAEHALHLSLSSDHC
ncbi:fructose-bisphosphate aldolase-lysine N-methyltransferase, chloroplastic isoform X1 [Brassica rapa]|uniref:fructose-bisphosphate aldolase-lysine N-methyltransferase, chloroplastic isoform X1 n=1 Tax=Brassica campestris TaxID=3711 RepID=UPI0004F15DEB|nr:fructose-bisphosphate aldolase-lysine N-methyltransferase, chloroplastic isoform X1 [Brassica rapa]